jgi:4-hydroxybenzoate polyprenyltransferase
VLLQFNRFTVILGLASLLTVAIYPFMKRVTDWPQISLGLAFSWGALMGWPALFGRLDGPPLLLYVGAILWTIGYDTIYAHQDKEDDALVGVRSTARLFADKWRTWTSVFYVLALALWAAAGAMAGAGWLAFVGLAAGGVQMWWQVTTLDIDDPERCLRLFKSNRDYGLIVFAGLVADAALRATT